MIISYDTVAKDLTIDSENGLEPLVLRAERLFFNLYADDGHVGCAMAGEVLDVYLEVVDDFPVTPVLQRIAGGHWRFTFTQGLQP